MEIKSVNNCPVCGFNLEQDPWGEGIAQEEIICPSCGIQFGYHDAVRNENNTRKTRDRYKELRILWVKNGMTWSSKVDHAPPNWNPEEQLKNIPEEFR